MVKAIGARMLPRNRSEVLLFLTGVNLMLLNFIVVQHVTIAIRQAEIAVLVFSLAYFSGISLGYLVSDRVTLVWIRRLLPLFLGAQLFLIVSVQCLHYVVSSDVERWAEARGLTGSLGDWIAGGVIFALITVGVTSLHSVFLPRVIESEGNEVRRCYSVEIFGSIVGLFLVPFLAGWSHSALLAGYLLSFLSVGVSLRSSRWVLASLVVMIGFFLLKVESWDRLTSTWFYKRWYQSSIQGVTHAAYTPYHKIEVLDLGGDEHMLLLNGKRQFARGSHYTYSYFVAEYPTRLHEPQTVCLLGCGSMSTIGRIGDLVDRIRIVDLDPQVFATSKKYFGKYNRLEELTNWDFVADDAKHFVANSEDQFDLILHDIPPAKSRQVALTYTAEFFELVKQRLSPQGVFSIASLTPFSSSSKYGKRLIKTLSHVFDRYFILVYRNSVYFYGGGGEMPLLSPEELREGIGHKGKDDVKIYIGERVDALVASERVITINNVGDLIYE